MAGSGKSAIAQSVSERLAGNGELAASVFFNRLERERSRKDYIVTTIAYQLAISIPALKRPICHAITKDETILNASFADQLLKLILEPLQSLPGSDTSMVVVIDGLDECEDFIEVAGLITKLVDPSSNPHFPLRFLVSSRPEPAIRAIFEHPATNCSTLRLNLEDFRPDADIRLFLERRLRDIPRLRSEVMSEISLPWPSSDDLTALVAKSAGLFIYASTLAMFVSDKDDIPHKRLNEVLVRGASPMSWGGTDLDQLYTQILSASSAVDHLMLVIGAIVFVKMPLSPRALSCLLEIEFGCVQLVLERLHSILSIPEDPNIGVVAPFHISLHDYLITRDHAGQFFLDPSLVHVQLAGCCLKRIRTLPKFTSPTFINSTHCWNAVVSYLRQVDTTNRITTQYACRYWSSHIFASSRKAHMDTAKLFCFRYALPWRMFMEIEARTNNITQSPEEMLIRDVRVRAPGPLAITFVKVLEVTGIFVWVVIWIATVSMIALVFQRKMSPTAFSIMLVLLVTVAMGYIFIYLDMDTTLMIALNMIKVSAPQEEVKICVLEAELSISVGILLFL